MSQRLYTQRYIDDLTEMIRLLEIDLTTVKQNLGKPMLPARERFDAAYDAIEHVPRPAHGLKLVK